MTTFELAMLAVALGGQVVTVGTVLASNAKAIGRQEAEVKGLGKSLDLLRADNATDHARYDRHIERQPAPGAN